jgi:hypothetical protein
MTKPPSAGRDVLASGSLDWQRVFAQFHIAISISFGSWNASIPTGMHSVVILFCSMRLSAVCMRPWRQEWSFAEPTAL